LAKVGSEKKKALLKKKGKGAKGMNFPNSKWEETFKIPGGEKRVPTPKKLHEGKKKGGENEAKKMRGDRKGGKKEKQGSL